MRSAKANIDALDELNDDDDNQWRITMDYEEQLRNKPKPRMERPTDQPNTGEHDVKVFHVNSKANNKGGFAFAHLWDHDANAFRVASDGLALMQVALHLSELKKAGIIATTGAWYRVTLSRARRDNSTFDFFGTLVEASLTK